MADESADIANEEQLVICFRWVDDDFEIYEDVKNTKVQKSELPPRKKCLNKKSLYTNCYGNVFNLAVNDCIKCVI